MLDEGKGMICMAKNKKKDPSDAVILLIFFSVLAIFLVASIFYQNTGIKLQGTEFHGGEISNEHKDYTWLAIIFAVLAMVGILWSIIRLLKHGILKKNKKKGKGVEEEKSKEELERDELIRAAKEVSEKRLRERELLSRHRYSEYGEEEEERRYRYSFEDESEEEEKKVPSNQALAKMYRFWEKFKRMPVQGKIVIGAAAAGAVAVIGNVIRMLIK